MIAQPRFVRLALFCLATAASTPVSAQRLSALRGNVLTDSTERPIRGAEVHIVALRLSAITDSAGGFRLIGVQPGKQLVMVKRLGFSPVTALVQFVAGDTLETDFLLIPNTTRLPGVRVAGKLPAPGLREFERHRATGFGHFLTTEQLEKMAGRQLIEVLALLPGPVLVRSNSSSAAWVAGGRGQQTVGNIFQVDRMDVARGAPTNQCWAAVYVNSVAVFQGRPGESLFDINSIAVDQIAGVEFYNGAGSMPVEYNASRNTCGAIAIWLK